MIATCVIWFCLIAEGTARQCAAHTADDETYFKIERPLGYAETADLPPNRFVSIEGRACDRIVENINLPINHRRVTHYVRRPAPKVYNAPDQ